VGLTSPLLLRSRLSQTHNKQVVLYFFRKMAKRPLSSAVEGLELKRQAITGVNPGVERAAPRVFEPAQLHSVRTISHHAHQRAAAGQADGLRRDRREMTARARTSHHGLPSS